MSKATLAICLTISLIFLLSGCAKTAGNVDELINIARGEFPVSDAETIDISIAGTSDTAGSILMWFVSGNENQAHTYLPLEFTIVSQKRVQFKRSCKPLDRGMDICALQWKDGYSFAVNNDKCVSIELIHTDGTTELVQVDKIPFVHYIAEVPSEYNFLDADENSIL